MSEVREHASVDDCWLVLHGLVLDVTSFLGEHPGGAKVLRRYAGSGLSLLGGVL